MTAGRPRNLSVSLVLLAAVCAGNLLAQISTYDLRQVPVSVLVNGPTQGLIVGDRVQFIATVILPGGRVEDCTENAQWESGDPRIASISANGIVTVTAVGAVDISATCQGIRGVIRVVVAGTPIVPPGSISTVPPSPVPLISGAPSPTGPSLRIHYLDVGQGDAAILIAPNGQTVMFDDGAPGACGAVVAYLRQLRISRIDYHVASHYHSDHIGCATSVFAAFSLAHGFDRGGSYSTSIFTRYVAALGPTRQKVVPGSTLVLGAVRIDIVAEDTSTGDENDRSVVAVVHYGQFDAEFGGDLTSAVEAIVAPKVGRIEVYKVHHHGSRYSSSNAWLSVTHPLVGIVSAGARNSYRHPTQESLNRLHAAGVRTYWTTVGGGAPPQAGLDTVAGNIVVEAQAGSATFTVRYGNATDTYTTWERAAATGHELGDAETAIATGWAGAYPNRVGDPEGRGVQ